MLLSLIVQASAIGWASPEEGPLIDRLGPKAPDSMAPIPHLGARSVAPTPLEDDTDAEDVVHPVVETFEGVPDPTFPPVMTASTRLKDDAEYFEAGVDETRSVEGDAALLENEARETIYDEVTRSPGISMSEVSTRTDVPLSTVRYHTWVLNKEDVIDEAKIRGKRRLFPTMMERERMELNAALEDDATARMLDTVYRHEPASVSELAESLDRSASTVSYHLQRLQDAGLVERERDGGATVTKLDPFVRAELSGTLGAERGLVGDTSDTSSDERPEDGPMSDTNEASSDD